MTVTQTLSEAVNPFSVEADVDRRAIWDALVARDSEAFAAMDWSICEADFAADRFEGISARGCLDPAEWSLLYPTLNSYRDDWIRMAKEFLAIPLVNVSHRDLLYRMQAIVRIEFGENRALAWKQFRACELVKGGGKYEISAQSVYRLHQIAGQWKIVGFVGYLPLEN